MELDIWNTLKEKDRANYDNFILSLGLVEGEEIKLLYNAFQELEMKHGKIRKDGYLLFTNENLIFMEPKNGKFDKTIGIPVSWIHKVSKKRPLFTNRISVDFTLLFELPKGKESINMQYNFGVPTNKDRWLDGHLVPESIDEVVAEINGLLEQQRRI